MSDRNRLWWAMLNPSSPRYEDWKRILGDEADNIPLITAASLHADLGDEKDVEVYLLDWQSLDGESSERLINTLAKKFGASTEEIEKDLDRDGHFPIRAADVTVAFSLRAFI